MGSTGEMPRWGATSERCARVVRVPDALALTTALLGADYYSLVYTALQDVFSSTAMSRRRPANLTREVR